MKIHEKLDDLKCNDLYQLRQGCRHATYGISGPIDIGHRGVECQIERWFPIKQMEFRVLPSHILIVGLALTQCPLHHDECRYFSPVRRNEHRYNRLFAPCLPV